MATFRHKKVLKKILENNGNVSKSMREVGYSENYAKNPQLLTETKGFKELAEQYLPDDLLLKVHKEGLEATQLKTSPTEPDKIVADYSTRHKYLDTAYKIKGKVIDKSELIGDFNLNLNFNEQGYKPKIQSPQLSDRDADGEQEI